MLDVDRAVVDEVDRVVVADVVDEDRVVVADVVEERGVVVVVVLADVVAELDVLVVVALAVVVLLALAVALEVAVRELLSVLTLVVLFALMFWLPKVRLWFCVVELACLELSAFLVCLVGCSSLALLAPLFLCVKFWSLCWSA